MHSGQAPSLLKENNPGFTLFIFAISFLISSKKPKNVAGVERPVAVIWDWSTRITLSSYSLAKTSLINELLPEPATPVTTVKTFNGILTDTFFKLWMFAFFIGKYSFGILGFFFISIFSFIAFPVKVLEINKSS